MMGVYGNDSRSQCWIRDRPTPRGATPLGAKKKTRRNQSGFGSVSEVSSAATVDGSEIPFPTHRLDGSKTL